MPRSPTGWARHSCARPASPPGPGFPPTWKTSAGSPPAEFLPRTAPQRFSALSVVLMLPVVLMSPVIPQRPMVSLPAQRSWWIRAMRLIWCTIVPYFHHEARINHDKSPLMLALVSEIVTGGTEVAAGRAYRRHRVGQERGGPAAGGARRGAHRRGRGRQGGGRARFARSGAGGRGFRRAGAPSRRLTEPGEARRDRVRRSGAARQAQRDRPPAGPRVDANGRTDRGASRAAAGAGRRA